MAYLDNTVITVDAVLTKLGRERLSQGGSNFNITKWAVSDDEVDYSLYNTAHPLGTDYYANIIESMPVLEAIPDETQALRYKLYTADDLSNLPYLQTIDPPDGNLALNSPREEFTFQPNTSNYNPNEDFVITLFNEDAAILEGSFRESLDSVQARANVTDETLTSAFRPGGAKNISGTLVRTSIGSSNVTVRAKDVRSSITTKIRIQGVDTGVTQTISFTVDPRQT